MMVGNEDEGNTLTCVGSGTSVVPIKLLEDRRLAASEKVELLNSWLHESVLVEPNGNNER